MNTFLILMAMFTAGYSLGQMHWRPDLGWGTKAWYAIVAGVTWPTYWLFLITRRRP